MFIFKYSYEKKWSEADEREVLKIIEEELQDADAKGMLVYLKSVLVANKIVEVGTCKFQLKKEK